MKSYLNSKYKVILKILSMVVLYGGAYLSRQSEEKTQIKSKAQILQTRSTVPC